MEIGKTLWRGNVGVAERAPYVFTFCFSNPASRIQPKDTPPATGNRYKVSDGSVALQNAGNSLMTTIKRGWVKCGQSAWKMWKQEGRSSWNTSDAQDVKKQSVRREGVYTTQGKEGNRAYLNIPHLRKQKHRHDKLKTHKTLKGKRQENWGGGDRRRKGQGTPLWGQYLHGSGF